jgi:transcriptional regulator with XRE-family HTH domain
MVKLRQLNTMPIRNEEMLDKDYRHGVVSAQFDVDLPLQIRALRKERGWTQPKLAAEAEMKQPRISAMERPGGANFTLETLRRLAKTFDVALIVRFAAFSELDRWSKDFDPDNFSVPSFDQELGFLDLKAPECNADSFKGSDLTIRGGTVTPIASSEHFRPLPPVWAGSIMTDDLALREQPKHAAK